MKPRNTKSRNDGGAAAFAAYLARRALEDSQEEAAAAAAAEATKETTTTMDSTNNSFNAIHTQKECALEASHPKEETTETATMDSTTVTIHNANQHAIEESHPKEEETSDTTATNSTNHGFITMHAAKRLKVGEQEDVGDNSGINSRAMRELRRTNKVNEQIGQLRSLLQDADFPLPEAASKYHVLQSCEKYIQQLILKSNQIETTVKPPMFGTSSASTSSGSLCRELVSSSIGRCADDSANSSSSSSSSGHSYQQHNPNHDQPPKYGYVDDSIYNNNYSNLNYNDIHDNNNHNSNNYMFNSTHTTTITNTTTNHNHDYNTVDIFTTTTNNNNKYHPDNDTIDYEHIVETSDLPIVIASADGQLLRANRLFFTVTGYEPQDIGDMTLFSMAIPAYRKQLFEAVGASLVSVLSSKKVSDHPLVVVIQSKTGHPLHVNISAVPQSMHDVNAFFLAPKNILCCSILPELDKRLLHTNMDVTTSHQQLTNTNRGQDPLYTSGGSAPYSCNGFITGLLSSSSGSSSGSSSSSSSNSVSSFGSHKYDNNVSGNLGGMDYGQTDSTTQAILSTVSRWMQ